MYLHAWKAGLKTTYYLRSRPGDAHPAGDDRHGAPRAAPTPSTPSDDEAARLLPREPRDLRGLRVTTTDPTPATTRMLLDPGMNLTLRPMRYPHFYERYRDAIKNTWTVEEVDLHTDLKDLQRLTAPSGTWSRGWWRSSPPATRSWRTTWC